MFVNHVVSPYIIDIKITVMIAQAIWQELNNGSTALAI